MRSSSPARPIHAPASPRARPASPVTKFAGDRPTPFRLHSNPLMVRAAAVLRLPWASATSGQRAGLCVRPPGPVGLGSSVFVSEDAEAPEYLKQSVGFGQPCGCALAARFVHQVLEHQNAARLEQLRGLLRERFGFAAHWEKRDLAGYAPVVGHNGPKMKQSAESEMEAPESSGPTRLDENLFPVIPPGYPPKGIVTFRNGDTLFNTGARHASMDILAVEL